MPLEKCIIQATSSPTVLIFRLLQIISCRSKNPPTGIIGSLNEYRLTINVTLTILYVNTKRTCNLDGTSRHTSFEWIEKSVFSALVSIFTLYFSCSCRKVDMAIIRKLKKRVEECHMYEGFEREKCAPIVTMLTDARENYYIKCKGYVELLETWKFDFLAENWSYLQMVNWGIRPLLENVIWNRNIVYYGNAGTALSEPEWRRNIIIKMEQFIGRDSDDLSIILLVVYIVVLVDFGTCSSFVY